MVGALLYALIIALPRLFIKIGWWRWRIVGLENLPPRKSGGMIVAMNHVNWLDILALGVLIPFSYRLSWLGKIEIFEHPLAGWFFRTMNVIPIKRGKRDLSALEASEKALKQGAVFVVFPEGHRSGDGVLQPGHGGTVRLAMRTGVPVVPVAITGSQHGLKGAFQRQELRMQVGKPYIVDPLPGNKIPPDIMAALTTDMMVRIAAMLPEEQRGPYQLPTAEASGSSVEETSGARVVHVAG
jgi:1-acyl-sn-glycerol-3-phosphate acyltransferase